MNDFIKKVSLLSDKDKELVYNLVNDLSISYDPDWVLLTEKEKSNLEEISKNGEFRDFKDVLKEFYHE
ncbi:hypothetical protein [Aedoeadaptatus coli]|uniref:hypothetical protein n=1 Tax=Aedoeadaptatus coli TaxID=2058292 RepID=UPI000D55264C|nr:hypothetical protein [Peptoniphilus coli]